MFVVYSQRHVSFKGVLCLVPLSRLKATQSVLPFNMTTARHCCDCLFSNMSNLRDANHASVWLLVAACKPTQPLGFKVSVRSPSKKGGEGRGMGWTVPATLGRASSYLTTPSLPEHTRCVGIDEEHKNIDDLTQVRFQAKRRCNCIVKTKEQCAFLNQIKLGFLC